MISEKKPHGAFYTYMIVAVRVWVKILPALKRKSTKGEMLAKLALIILAAVGGVFAVFYINENYLNPPVSVYGTCLPPAYVTATNQCVAKETIQVSGTETTVTVPAGTILQGGH